MSRTFPIGHLIKLSAMVLIATAGFTTTQTQANLLVNGGFESFEVTSGSGPAAFGDWGAANGDTTTIVTGPENGISAFEGQNMIRFDSTTGGSGGVGGSIDVVQVIDVSASAALIASGNARLDVMGFLNRVAGDSQTDTAFELTLHAYSGTFSGWPPGGSLAGNVSTLISDGDVGTWESLSGSLVLPVATSFVGVFITASENVFNDTSGELDGHYADAFSAVVTNTAAPVSAPGMALLLSAGVFALGAARRRSRD